MTSSNPPELLLQCYGQPFGTPVAEAFEQEGNELGPETRGAIRGLKQAIEHIRRGYSEDHVRLGNEIDFKFYYDHPKEYREGVAAQRRAGNSVLSWLQRANHADFAEFCNWHVRRQGQLQERLGTDQPKLEADTMYRADMLIDKGFFPPQAHDQLARAITHKGRIHLMDSFESSAMQAIGYCNDERIALANLFTYSNGEGLNFEMRRTAFHEWTHAVGDDRRRGFYHGIGKGAGKSYILWLEEAYVSMAAREAMAPERTKGGHRIEAAYPDSYPEERGLLALLCESASAPMSGAELSEAFFEQKYGKANQRYRVESLLRRSFANLFPAQGMDSMQEFTERYLDAGVKQKREQLTRRWAKEAKRRLYGSE